jgi:adhesin transport system outer membrane protein
MLRKFIFALSVSTAICLPVVSQAATLSDSITQALSSHPQIKAGEASRAQADNNIREQRSAFFPTIGIDGEAGHQTNNDIDTRSLTSDAGTADSWYGRGTATLTQPLFSGFGTVDRVLGARDRYRAAAYDLEGTSEDIALRAARAHLNLMRTKELRALASQFLSDIDSRQKNIALMFKEGAADEAELLQANEIQAAAKNTRLGYEESFRQAEADYIEVAGGAPDASLELGEATWNALIAPTLEDAVANAVSESPRIRAAEKISAALTNETKAEKSALAPRVDAALSYMKQDQLDVVGGEASSARAMLKLGWNFSTGGGQLARIEKSRQQQAEALAKRQGVMRSVEYGVRQKYTSMEIADQQFALLTDRETASKKILENFLAQFEGGKQTNLQLIAANSRLFESQAARTDAYYRRVLTRLELLNAMGRLRDAFEPPKVSASAKAPEPAKVAAPVKAPAPPKAPAPAKAPEPDKAVENQ